MLAFDVPRGEEHEMTLVYLHGFGMRARDVAATVKAARPPGWRVVLPQAPLRPITAHGGAASRSWYDYLTDRGGSAEDDVDGASLTSVRALLEELLRREARRLGGGRLGLSRVVVGGMSQGGCMALEVAARLPVAAVVTVVAHRHRGRCAAAPSPPRPLRCPWHALTAVDDDVFPASWAHETLRAAAVWVQAPGGHYLEAGPDVEFLATTLRRLQASSPPLHGGGARS